jgi:hypothetical protein
MDTDADGTCDSVDPDDDGDGVPDVNDVYPKDVSEWEDRNGDGLGDNAHPLSIIDHMKLNPGLTAVIIILILAVIGAAAAVILVRKKGDEAATYADDQYSSYDNTESWDESQPIEEEVSEFSEIPPAPPGFEEEAIADNSEDVPPPPPGFESESEEVSEVPPAPPGFEEVMTSSESEVPPPPPGFDTEPDTDNDDSQIPPPPPGF